MYLTHQAEGTKIRAKIEHIKQNEHPSQFFFKLEKQQAKQKTIDKLSINENITTDSNMIKMKYLDITHNYIRKQTQTLF